MDTWQHRLLQLDYLPAGELARRFNLLNPRSHPESQKDATESSLEKVQWIDEVSLSTNGDGSPLLADNPDAVLFDGHERVEIVLARFGPDALVPVKWYRLSKEETDFALLVKDQTTGMAEYIPERLAELIERTKAMTASEPRLAGMLEALRLKAGVNGKGQAGNDAEPQIDKAQQLKEKWGVELGQLWQLGEHRLICGDCTDMATVERVMGGERARLVVTDPPYDGQLGGAGFNKTPDVKMRVNRMQSSIEHLYTFNPNDIFPVCESNTAPPLVWFFFCNKRLVPVYVNYALNSKRGFDLLLWHKPNFLPMAGAHYFPDTEYIVKIRDKGAIFNNGIPKEVVNYGTYWVIESQKGDSKEAEHPTVKPTKIIRDQISICSNRDELVIDPFLGSGTTLIACENLNRRCRAVEIDPGYVAVTLQRWADLTGLTPTLVSG